MFVKASVIATLPEAGASKIAIGDLSPIDIASPSIESK